tara:strand:- start:605 stop:1432 length:828 start_codon:yes stop_codon:yes gene_type:complete
MAETLTVDTTPQTETLGDNLTPDEQDSLKVGEEMMNQQEQLLAGKYKNAEELEKAYVELQSKLGEKGNQDSETTSQSEVQETEEVSEEKDEATDFTQGAQTIMSASDEYYKNDGKLSEETLNKFTQMSSRDLVEAYMEVQKSGAMDNNSQSVEDLSQQAINEVKNYAGGEQAYDSLVQWAGQNLDQNSINAFDSIINTGSVDAIKIAVNGLKAQYQDANGYEGKMYTGKAPVQKSDIFRSQAELVQAMSDRRYERDPAYRQDVIEKLERSDNLAF